MKIIRFFFEDQKRESSKPFKIIHTLITVSLLITALLAFIVGFGFFIKSALLLGGIMFLVNGIEGYLMKDQRKKIVTDLCVSVLLFVNYFLQ
ncbi:hypothetical protein A8F94_07910 [Bacillus sp. FJAT-27225]|uniref:hypothetical protein n=1 Tax=Bacillus sp. FJAT-27225 TaxID=1743144 RepID=UPI00080C269A|nr:hypothetical protein [Bacillus sp. FJAT-27225]OCA87764.1 hypothetical protein A8F94_07910 [Bacillus sp. FJAT-27225]